MASAIATLGLADSFDAVYGSSAGSIVGAYMISRQMCVDVYTEILVAAKETFVCKKRLMGNLVYCATKEVVRRGGNVISGGNRESGKHNRKEAKEEDMKVIEQLASIIDANNERVLSDNENLSEVESVEIAKAANSSWVKSLVSRMYAGLPLSVSNATPFKYVTSTPGMNITFVLDGIMCQQNGLRPLDFETFRQNDAMQPLRVVSSAVSERTGEMETFILGAKENDFFETVDNKNVTFCASTDRQGLFACLAASMTVPGATGPPLALQRNGDDEVARCFDAFCYEPMPYRSAVEENATHVLVLRTRPEGCAVVTKPTIYERVVAPLYFNSNNLPQVAKYFECGGQQYRYLEDVLTLEKARNQHGPVEVPPSKILHGGTAAIEDEEKDPSTWKKAHLYPVTLPRGAAELSVISTEQDEVLYAVRNGFAAAFELLAPVAGLDLSSFAASEGKSVPEQVAELVFPDDASLSEDDMAESLRQQLEVKGDAIVSEKERTRRLERFRAWMKQRRQRRRRPLSASEAGLELSILTEEDLLTQLPAFKEGKLSHLSKSLRRV
jgi:hypothetical protein